jgi:hypothetical protein
VKIKSYHVHSFDFEGDEYIARFDWKTQECYIYKFFQSSYEQIAVSDDLQEFKDCAILKKHLDDWCKDKIIKLKTLEAK